MPSNPDRAELPPVYVCTDSCGEHPRALRDMFAAAGYRVHVVSLFTPEQYRRWRTGGLAGRLWLRLLGKLLGPLLICLRSLRWPRNSVLIANTNLLFAPLGLALLAKLKGYRVVYLLYDLFPDALEVHEGGRRSGIVHRMLVWLTRSSLRQTAATVFLGEFLQAHVVQRYGAPRVAAVIDVASPAILPVAATASEIPTEGALLPKATLSNRESQSSVSLPRGSAGAEAPPAPVAAFPPVLRLRYGGQLGFMHCPSLTAAATIAATRQLGDKVHFDFFASGPGVAEVGAQLAAAGITIAPLAFEPDWKERLQHYDFALVALSPGGATVCFPSKTYGMLAAGLPVIAICPHWSDLGLLLARYGVGFVVSNSPFDAVIDTQGRRRGLSEGRVLDMRSPKYLEEVLELRDEGAVGADFCVLLNRLQAEPELGQQARRNAMTVFAEAFSGQAMLQRWQALLAAAQPGGSVAAE